MVYKKENRAESSAKGLAESLQSLEDTQKRSASLDLEIKKGLMRIFPELVMDYDEIVHRAYLGSSFSARVDYKERVKQLGIEAKEIINSGIKSAEEASVKESIDETAESIKEAIAAKEALAKQISSTDKKSDRVFLVYSSRKLDSITLSYIESQDSELRSTLSKYKMDKLVIAASCEGMMANGIYSDVVLRYKTFASAYKRVALDDKREKKAAQMLKEGSASEAISDYVHSMGGIFNANIVPRLIPSKHVFELASEVYYYEDYNDAVRRAHSDLMRELLESM